MRAEKANAPFDAMPRSCYDAQHPAHAPEAYRVPDGTGGGYWIGDARKATDTESVAPAPAKFLAKSSYQHDISAPREAAGVVRPRSPIRPAGRAPAGSAGDPPARLEHFGDELAHGQVHGGVAGGIAQALMEEFQYADDGTPMTTNFMDYGFISAAELPSFERVEHVTPTDLNPLGVKGIGEAGTIGATPAVQNAVVDAIAHLGIEHIDIPVTSERVWRVMNGATC